MTAVPKQADPQALLYLPPGPGTDAVRAGLMAMKCVPTNLPLAFPERLAVLLRAAQSGRVFLVIDISNQKPASGDSLAAVCKYLPLALRPRTLLTRLVGGHVNAEDRAWAKSLGFLDLIADFDMHDLEGGLRNAVNSAALLLGLAPLSTTELARYVGAVVAAYSSASVPIRPHTASSNDKLGPVVAVKMTARGTIRALTHLSAEALAALLSQKLAVQDRTYHFKRYPACFVASEAVAWMVKRLNLAPADAVAVGQALGALGLLFHVEHKHIFENEQWFFRLAVSRAASVLGVPIDYEATLQALRLRILVADRTYLGTPYLKCWVGAQAVDALIAHRPMPRHEAYLVLHRLMACGLFHHVVNEQPFVDGNFYYRWGD